MIHHKVKFVESWIDVTDKKKSLYIISISNIHELGSLIRNAWGHCQNMLFHYPPPFLWWKAYQGMFRNACGLWQNVLFQTPNPLMYYGTANLGRFIIDWGSTHRSCCVAPICWLSVRFQVVQSPCFIRLQFDPAVQRFLSMRFEHWNYYKATPKTVGYGLAISLLPMVVMYNIFKWDRVCILRNLFCWTPSGSFQLLLK